MKPRWGGLPLAFGFVVDIAGLIITAGCVLTATGILSETEAVKQDVRPFPDK